MCAKAIFVFMWISLFTTKVVFFIDIGKFLQ